MTPKDEQVREAEVSPQRRGGGTGSTVLHKPRDKPSRTPQSPRGTRGRPMALASGSGDRSQRDTRGAMAIVFADPGSAKIGLRRGRRGESADRFV